MGDSAQAAMDRTDAFFAAVDVVCRERNRQPVRRARPPKTPFFAAATNLGRALHELHERVARVTVLATKTSLFDDPAHEIAEVSVHVKAQLAMIGRGVEQLAAAPRHGRQLCAHTDAVLLWFKAALERESADFQAAIKRREGILSHKESRAAKLSSLSATPLSSTSASGGGIGGSPTDSTCAGRSASAYAAAPVPRSRGLERGSLLQRRRGGAGGAPHCSHAPPYTGNGAAGADAVSIDMAELGGSPPPLQQQSFWTPRSRQHRQEEMSQMQSTLAELGGIFQRFSTLVAEQGESISIIDTDTETAVLNVEEAHSQIMRFQKSIMGNRGLIIKLFATLTFFIVLFGTVIR